MTDNPVKTALALLKAHPHWYIFPIMRGEKKPPCFDDNLALASSDPAVVKRWAAQYPSCNWGLSCAKSRMIVVDVDTKPGKVGRDTLDMLQLEWGELPPTLTARSPSGGLHYYFSETNVVRHRMKVGAFGKDVESTNYVLLPDSILRERKSEGQFPGRYRFTRVLPVAPAPDWFALYLDKPDIADADQVPAVEQDTPDIIAHAVHYLTHDAKPSIQFQNGEYTLLMTAADLKDMGVSQPMSVELLAKHYNVPKGKPGRPYCEPLWEIGEGATADRLDIKVANAWLYLRQTTPGANTPDADFGDAPIDNESSDIMEAGWKTPEQKAWHTKKARKARAKAKADAKLRRDGQALVRAIKQVIHE